MGLNLTGYVNLGFVEELAADLFDDKYDYDEYFHLYAYEHFADRHSDLVTNGVYKVQEVYSFRGGSYSGYNWWRELLCRIVFDVEPNVVWNNEEVYKDKPFYYLINFTDSDGVIGPKICKQLAQEFKENHLKVTTHPLTEELEWFVENYEHFLRLFENSDIVRFH